MNVQVKGKKVAILVTNGFEQSEFTGPRDALTDAGVDISVVSLEHGEIQGMHHDKKANRFAVDKIVSEVKCADFDALLLPGGVMNPDVLRGDEQAVAFVRDFFTETKPVFAICHGPQVLITAGVVKGRTFRISTARCWKNWLKGSIDPVSPGLAAPHSKWAPQQGRGTACNAAGLYWGKHDVRRFQSILCYVASDDIYRSVGRLPCLESGRQSVCRGWLGKRQRSCVYIQGIGCQFRLSERA